jgi:lactam utilization protein B
MSAALLRANYQDQTVKVLEDLRTGLLNKQKQELTHVKEHNAKHESYQAEHAYARAIAFGIAADDVACFILRERAR